MQIAKSLVMKPPSMVSMHTASSASQKVFSSALLSSFARCSRPRVQAKMEAVKRKDSRSIQTYYVIKKYVYTVYFVGICMILDLWDWWKSPFPLGVVCSDGSQCRGQLQTPLCDHQDTPVHLSSYPGSRSLMHKRTPISSWGMRHSQKKAFWTNLVPPSQTARPHRSSCRPKWSRRRISLPGPPCHRSGDAHTRCLCPENKSCSPWRNKSRENVSTSRLCRFTQCVYSVEIVFTETQRVQEKPAVNRWPYNDHLSGWNHTEELIRLTILLITQLDSSGISLTGEREQENPMWEKYDCAFAYFS